jgi:hypothetical protein
VFVFVDQPAEQVGAIELQIGWRSERCGVSVCLLGWTKCECSMRPTPVVMAGIDAKYVVELPAAEDEQPVEALAADAADPALGVGVRVRRLDGRADHRNSFALEDVIAPTAELGVAIVDQEAERLLAIIEGHQQVARLLGDPGASWGRRAGDEFDPAAFQRDEEEHVDPSQPGGLDGEEIAGERVGFANSGGLVFVDESAEEIPTF